jgi:hypothetical protein
MDCLDFSALFGVVLIYARGGSPRGYIAGIALTFRNADDEVAIVCLSS